MVRKKLEKYLPRFAQSLKLHDNYLILTHRRPDGDTVGSAAALCLALRKIGKTAYLFENTEMPRRLSDYFNPYKAPQDYAYENTISVDIPAYAQMGEAEIFRGKLDFVIDHHTSNIMSAKKGKLVERSAAATGEIVYYLIKALDVSIDKEIAELLYISISTDTGCFKYSNTTAETHAIASDLISIGVNLEYINSEFFEKKRLARFEMERLVYSDLQFYCDGKIAAIYVSLEMREKTGATEDDIDDFSAIPRQIEGVEAGISLYEQSDGAMKVSLRTTSKVDAAKVCAAFSGGGHPRAGGCTINAGHKEAASLMVKELEKYICE